MTEIDSDEADLERLTVSYSDDPASTVQWIRNHGARRVVLAGDFVGDHAVIWTNGRFGDPVVRMCGPGDTVIALPNRGGCVLDINPNVW